MKRFILIFALIFGSLDAAIVTRYFSTAAAGAGDGTTWADRAQLVNAGTVSTVITGFSFAGSDSLVCYVGPGNYTFTAALTTGLSPTAANPLIFHGCDSSGSPLTPPDPDWLSCKPSWDDSGLPVFITTTSVATAANSATVWRLIKFTASGRNGAIVTAAAAIDWCSIENTTNNAAADGINATVARVQNCIIAMTGDAYNAGIVPQGGGALIDNCRIMGVTGSSGDRRGVEHNGTTTGVEFVRCTIIRNGGDGIGSASTNAGQFFMVSSCVIANNGGTGIGTASTASQTAYHQFRNNMVTGNGTYGIDGQNEAQVIALTNRLRDNTSGDINGLDNWPTDLGNYTTDSDDSTEYVDAGNGTTSLQDYTIKSGATIATMGFGVAVQATGGQSSYSY